MKKIFRKNQVIITALALMIAVAGYISYTQSNTADEQTAKTESASEEASSKTTYEISDEDAGDGTDDKKEENSEKAADSDQAKTDEQGENPGETVLTSTEAQTVDFASEMKLNREQVRSKSKEDLLEIINNDSITEAQKQEAIDKMVELTDVAERENAAEILLEAKGFSDVVVSITDDGADVVLNMGEVTDAKRAQIEDIMKRKTGVSAENIVITPISEDAGK